MGGVLVGLGWISVCISTSDTDCLMGLGPPDEDLRLLILIEAYSIPYAIHPGRNKMPQDLLVLYSWIWLKKDVADFVARCFVCQKTGIHSLLEDFGRRYMKLWVRRFILVQLIIRSSMDNWRSFQKSIHMAPFEALYGRRYRTPLCWFDMEEKRNLGPELLDRIHDVLHVSILRKYRSDPSHVVLVKEIEIRSDLLYKEEPVAVLDREVKVLDGSVGESFVAQP
ncbi:uncharacterized protein LOC105781431 [Gossypium raimondii]|uniref:uncharacterized protein LOC105781431 n=1 Tax=Gossypium raimondii TaxID=29730 RepID=UPI00063AFA75|nr:uncharacterized protein LOC105781431 [Gossypium raimondii]